MSSSSGLSNLGIALTVLFILTLFALLAQLFYVLHRRRSLLRQIPTTTTTTTIHGGEEDAISKEQLLYFFCMRTSNLSRVEPSRSPGSNGSGQENEIEVDMLKVQGTYGPSRVLCTIKEGEREGVESADEKPAVVVLEDEKVSKTTDEKSTVVVVEDEKVSKTTDEKSTFSTPCGSPQFLTPSGSLTEDELRSLPV